MKHLTKRLFFCFLFVMGCTISFGQSAEAIHQERELLNAKVMTYLENNSGYRLSSKEQERFDLLLDSDDHHEESIDVEQMMKKFTRSILIEKFLIENPDFYGSLEKSTPTSYPDPCYLGDFETNSFITYEGYWHMGTNNMQCDQIPLDVVADPGYASMGSLGVIPEFERTNNVPDPIVPASALSQTNGGSNHALRINPDDGGGQDISVLRKNFSTATTGDQIVSFSSAIVLEFPHNNSYDPFMTARILDATGSVVGGPICITPISAGIDWTPFNVGSKNYVWMDWKCFQVPYYGVTGDNYVLEVSVGDCGYSVHGGYAYIDDICNKVCSPINLDCCDALAGQILSWSDVPDAVSYEVSVYYNDPNCCPGTTEAPLGMSYIVTDNIFMIPTDYSSCFSWKVRAVFADGSKTDFSEVLCDCGSDPVEPCKAPVNLDCENLNNYRVLSWDAVAGAVGGYIVEIIYNDPSCCPVGGTVSTDVISTTDTWVNIPDGSTCFSWKVRSVCSGTNMSDWSEILCACDPVEPCKAPTNLDCDNLNNYRVLSWDPVAGALGGYIVEITYNDPSCCPVAGTVSTDVISTTDTWVNVPDGSTCFSWKVRSVCSSSSMSDWSSTLCACGPDNPCKTPVNLNCKNFNNYRVLSWDAVAGALGGYIVEITYNDPDCCPAGSGSVSTVTMNTTDTWVNVIDGSTCFSWKVRSVCNTASLSDWSAKVCACPPNSGMSTHGNLHGEHNAKDLELLVVPNPADEFVSMTLNSSEEEFSSPSQLVIFDATGARVLESKIELNTEKRFNVSNLSPGVYIYNVFHDDGLMMSGKLIIE